MDEIGQDERMFFAQKPGALALYECLREKMRAACSPMDLQVKKTQISLLRRRLFGAVSFLPVKKAKERPDPYITVTFALDHRVESPRIAVAVEAYPRRWTHHVLIGSESEVDAELLEWLEQAAAFACVK